MAKETNKHYEAQMAIKKARKPIKDARKKKVEEKLKKMPKISSKSA